MDEMPVTQMPAPAVGDAALPPAGAVQSPGPRSRIIAIRLAISLIGAVVLLIVWNILARSYPVFILPGPLAVWQRFVTALQDGTFGAAVATTMEEALLGWLVAAVIALPGGYVIGTVRQLEDALAPYLAGSQAMPVVAIAPLLVVWVGFGLTPKVIVCALISFFPMVATTASGVRGVPRDLRDAARVFGAGALALARYVDIPLAARSMFSGIKVGATLSITGAVVGEFVSSQQGLGHLIMLGRENFDTPLMFVALVALVVLGALVYSAVSLIERAVLRWEE